MKLCSIEGCNEKCHAKGLCKKHYEHNRCQTPEAKARRNEWAKKHFQDPERNKKRRIYQRDWRREEREDPKARAKRKEYYSRPEVKERTNILLKERRHKLRLQVISHYSQGKNECACCGEKHIKFLSLNHINGKGNQHRKEIFGHNIGGYLFYEWLIRNKYPEGYNVLCFNCNCAKGFYGSCPHDAEREEADRVKQ